MYLRNHHNNFELDCYEIWITSYLHGGYIVAFTNLKLKEIDWWEFDTRGSEPGDFDKREDATSALGKKNLALFYKEEVNYIWQLKKLSKLLTLLLCYPYTTINIVNSQIATTLDTYTIEPL